MALLFAFPITPTPLTIIRSELPKLAGRSVLTTNLQLVAEQSDLDVAAQKSVNESGE